MTRIFNVTSDLRQMYLIEEAAKVIRNNGTVAFPTETVYGLGANGLEEEAVKKIFEAKGRPSDNPLILHISDLVMLDTLVENIPDKAKTLASNFWPGPLTMVFKKSSLVPDIITAGLDTVAIRMPSNPIARCLIRESRVPIAAPSANTSGRPSTTRPQHVIEDLDGKVDIIISSEASDIGVESTVLDMTVKIPTVLRPGGITVEELEAVLGRVNVDKGILKPQDKPKSPGMKYRHYSPKARVRVVKGSNEKVVSTINELSRAYSCKGLKVGVLATEEMRDRYKADCVLSLGERRNPEEIMCSLFDCLREFDKYEVDVVLSEGFSETGKELAIANRLNKAAGYDIIEV